MNVIRFSNTDVLDFLGGFQKRMEGRKYRFNKFLIKSEYNKNEEVWYNAFTGALISINKLETEAIFVDYPCDYSAFLFENYFIVPENFDEDSIFMEYRYKKSKPVTANALDRLKSYTILTTTECNARCFYCYQKGDDNKHKMTAKTARDVVRYITQTSQPESDIFIGWFGGEPTYNMEVMDIITQGVIASGRRVHSSMISNGYLFSKEVCEKAVNDWFLQHVQITLDGTEEIYNRSKKYIYRDDPSPFKTVIQNIHYMLEVGLPVSIRMNCDVHNLDNLKELITFIHNEFGENPLLTAYAHELFEDEGKKRSDEHNKKIFENMIELEDLITKYHLREQGYSVPDSIKTIHCMVDSDDATIISPGGELGLCEHYQNSKFYGHINDLNTKDFEVIRDWREMSKYGEICEDCPFKPGCLKSKQCPDHNICNKYEKDYTLYRIKQDMNKYYDDFKIEQKRIMEQEESSNQDKCGDKCKCSPKNCNQHRL